MATLININSEDCICSSCGCIVHANESTTNCPECYVLFDGGEQ